MTEVLAPCPFCGRVPTMRDTRARLDEGLLFVLVHDCESLGHNFQILGVTYDGLVERWNRRAEPPVPQTYEGEE